MRAANDDVAAITTQPKNIKNFFISKKTIILFNQSIEVLPGEYSGNWEIFSYESDGAEP